MKSIFFASILLFLITLLCYLTALDQRDNSNAKIIILRDSCKSLKAALAQSAGSGDPFRDSDTVMVIHGSVFMAKKIGWVSPKEGWSTSGKLVK